MNALPGLIACPGGWSWRRSAEVDAPTVREPNALGSDDDDRYDDRLLPAIETVRAFMLESLDAACEGVMLKRLDGDKSRYSPSKRSDCWLKLKKDYCENLRDSLDLVPIGAWFGQGRKAGWYSPFLLAVYDPETETYQSMCRCMSGFTDEFYRTRRENFGKPPSLIESGVKPPVYDTLEQPDVWFNPTEVWEIRGADLTLSPKHRAAAGAKARGEGDQPQISAVHQRQGRQERGGRASGPEEVARLFDAQQSRYDGQGESATRRLAEQAALDARLRRMKGISDEDTTEATESRCSAATRRRGKLASPITKTTLDASLSRRLFLRHLAGPAHYRDRDSVSQGAPPPPASCSPNAWVCRTPSNACVLPSCSNSQDISLNTVS